MTLASPKCKESQRKIENDITNLKKMLWPVEENHEAIEVRHVVMHVISFKLKGDANRKAHIKEFEGSRQ